MPTIASWTDPSFPCRIDYSRETMEQIRLHAIEGLLALPRFGMGTGGLLLGAHEAGGLTILESLEIPCAHAMGPSFGLTEEETQYARDLIAQAGPLKVVGWYCSKTRGNLGLTAADQELFLALCPYPWQIALTIKPSTVGPTRAVFCFRDFAGGIAQSAERDLEHWELKSTPPDLALAAESQPAPPAPPAPETPLAPVAPPVAEAVVIASAPERVFFQSVMPTPRQGNGLRSWLAATSICAACTVAYLMKDSLLPRPPLKLDLSDLNGHLTIHWNPDAVRGINRGLMFLDDGGELRTIPLNNDQLNAGALQYDRKSERVTATLKAGEGRALISFLAPARPAAAQPSR